MKQAHKFWSKQVISLLLAFLMLLPNFALPVQASEPETAPTEAVEQELAPETEILPEEIPEELPETIPEETPEMQPEETPEVLPEIIPEETPDGLPEIIGPADEELLPELEAMSETPAVPSNQTSVPVALPTDASKIVHIASAEDMKKIDPSDPDGYYVLDSDITLGKKDYTYTDTFCGTFDGRGHTITFNKIRSAPYLFKVIDAGAVIQNVRFAGSIQGTGSNGAEYGPCSNVVRGSVINCVSEIEGGNDASGFTRDLDGGMISNCLSVGTAGNDAICKNYKSGSVENTYWTESLTSSIPADALVNSSAKSTAEFSNGDLLSSLNANTGSNGCEWVMGEAGYPILVPAPVEESGPEPEIPPVSAEPKVYFQTDDGQRVDMDETRTFTMNALSQGTFKVEGAEEAGKTVTWDCESITDYVNKHYWITSSGRYSPYSNLGRVPARATVNPDGTTINFYIDNVSSNIVELKVFGQNQETKEEKEMSLETPYITDGSKWVNLIVKGRIKDKDEWVTIPNSPALEYESDGHGMLPATGRFQVNNNAEAEFGVTFRENNGELKIRFKASSKPVGVTSFKVTVPAVWYIHEWNDLGGYYLGIKPGTDPNRQFQTSFEPANAGNKKLNWKALTPEIAEYMVAFDNGIIPKKAGVAKFEVTSDDNPSLKQIVQVDFRYQEPLKSASVEQETIVVKEGESPDFVIHTNPEDASEQRFHWTYDKEGIVKIGDTVNVDPNDVGTPKWTTHTITALKSGTVQVTGTPYDDTENCAPIHFTVQVTKDGTVPEDTDYLSMAKTDIQHGVKELKKQSQNKYHQEWSIFATLRAGETIAQEKLDQYYASVEAKVQKDAHKMRPTDFARVIITLEAMGKDPASVGGINLLEQLYNSSIIENDTSNGAIWALIALDGWKSEIPANAKWTRDKLVQKILTFQTAEGGFGLVDNRTCSVDMTGMALQSLAPYQSKPEVKQATARALQYLKDNMTGVAGYNAEGGPNSCTAAQVLTALTALKLDPVQAENGFTRNSKNLITNIHSFRVEAGGFGLHDGLKFDGMSTEQVVYALVSYQRMADGMTGLYDLTDTKKETEKPSVDPADQEAANRVIDAIDRIGTVTLNSEYAIRSARAAYTALTPAQQELVTNYTTLVRAEQRLQQLQDAEKPNPDRPDRPDPTPNPEKPEKPEELTVTLSVDLKTIGKGYIVAPTKVKIKDGHTVWEVLQAVLNAKGIAYEYEDYAQYGSVYVQSIDGEGEFDHGPGSGWMYNVNGIYPEFGCSLYKLHGGETIQWRYTTNLGEDLKNAAGDNGATPDSKPKPDSKPGVEESTENDAFPFADARYHWAKDSIRYVYEKGLMMGTGSNSFTPDGTLNRAMLATILYRMAGSPRVTSVNMFSDVAENTWYTDAVIWANENGIVEGVGDGQFAPMANVTREQMAAMLYRYAKTCNMRVNKANDLHGYADANEIHTWAEAAMEWANAEGLIVGRTAITIEPNDVATRAEAATILMRFDMLNA